MKSSKSIKTVKRTYKTKKGLITKTYSYDASKLTSRKRYVISSSGKINKSAIKRLVDKGVGTAVEIRAKIAEQLGLGNKSVSEQRLEASITHNQIEGMFANAGLTVEYAASSVGATTEMLYDKANWNGDMFTNPETGETYQFRFSYTGSVWERVVNE